MTTIQHPTRSEQSSLARNLMAKLVRSQSADLDTTDDRSLVAALMQDVTRERATDVHIAPYGDGLRVRLRSDGELYDAANLSADDGTRLINQLKTMASLDPVAAFVPKRSRRTFKLDDHELDLRITTAPCLGGEKVAIRVLDPANIVSRTDQLGMSPAHRELLQSWLDSIEGMCVVTGPTGSGKTTMLYALLQELKLQNRNIITIEDPVEYDVHGVTQIQVNERHGLTFDTGLAAMLRLDPDYLLVGEVRSPDTARVALTAATSGHVIMTTLHSPDAVGAVIALRNWGLTGHEIADALRIVVAQRLVRTLCPHCREQTPPDDAQRQWYNDHALTPPAKTWRPRGCPECGQRGYAGRTGVFEMWRLSRDDLEFIRRHGDAGNLYRNLSEQDHVFMLDDGLAKVREGVTTIEEIQRSRVSLAHLQTSHAPAGAS
jgi:general secretion pathway protein E